jgi:putative ATP-dependent endonuclease of the OLD family
MARIRMVEIKHFRGIGHISWRPTPGLNCLIGPGDSGKSTVLDAIDFCIGARRNIQFTDVDFHKLDVGTPITVSITIGELDDSLKNLDSYGLYLRGFESVTGKIVDEPESGAETVLTVLLTVCVDLEPVWTLVSERAVSQGQSRNLSWSDRTRLAPTRLGAMSDYNLSWRKGSVLNRVSDERADATAALAKAAREVRATFGADAKAQLAKSLAVVSATARELGIQVGPEVQALLDAQSVSFAGGTLSLHDANGIPLHGLGIGSIRLLIAGLQRRAAAESSMILIDEVEHGLEPHRIIRLLGSLGAKEKEPPLQVFMTTHSPVVLRELGGHQLMVLRRLASNHQLTAVGHEDGIQGAIRTFPEAFLAQSVLVCEGATEVGLVRGLDLYRVAKGSTAFAANGVALVDAGGEKKLFGRAAAFQSLQYRTAVLRDDDAKPGPELEKNFKDLGGRVFAWRDGRALEDELFLYLDEPTVFRLIDRACELWESSLVDAHIKSASNGKYDLAACKSSLSVEKRTALGKAARTKKAGWFKTVSAMEAVAFEIVGPNLTTSDVGFQNIVEDVFLWAGQLDPKAVSTPASPPTGVATLAVAD